MSIPSTSNNLQPTSSGIKMLNSEFIDNLFISTLGYLLLSSIFSFIFDIVLGTAVVGASLNLAYFVAATFLTDSIFREKNLLYRVKTGFIRESSYYILAFLTMMSLSLPTEPLNLTIVYRYLASIVFLFIPVIIAYVGYKLKLI